MRVNLEKQQAIGVVTPPIGNAGITPLSNLVNILRSFSSSVYVVTGNEGASLPKGNNQGIHIFGIRHKSGANILTRIIKHIYMQLRISFELMRQARNVGIWIFFLDAYALLLPVLTAKLMRRKIILELAASLTKTTETRKDVLAKVLIYSEMVSCRLSNRIIVYSEALIDEWGLEKYRSKISIASEHFVDFNKFKIQRQLYQRSNLVGYIGRLSDEKGILNFVRAISKIFEAREDITFLIVGEGPLRDEVEEFLSKMNLTDRVELAGWVPHDELPEYLNKLKLVVLPSYTEGLPNIVLEAVACGTPVLVTPVGAISNVIKDGETGFIIKDNSPEFIARDIIRALNHSDLEGIAKNARAFVEKEYTYAVAVEKHRNILAHLK